MAKQNPSRGAGARRGPRAGAKRGGDESQAARRGGTGRNGKKPATPAARGTAGADGAPRQFRLGAIPGATPGKWLDRWGEQRPQQRLELVPLSVLAQRAALDDGLVDAAIVRLPLAGQPDDVHIVRLYDEVPVVVASNESSLMAADELTPDDLAGEVRIVAGDDVYGGLELPTEPARFAPPATAEEAIEIAASGVGIVVVPMSIARAHQRRDVDYRPLAGGPVSPVALAWLRSRDADDVQHLVGITRGRGARSSR